MNIGELFNASMIIALQSMSMYGITKSKSAVHIATIFVVDNCVIHIF